MVRERGDEVETVDDVGGCSAEVQGSSGGSLLKPAAARLADEILERQCVQLYEITVFIVV